MNQDEFDKVKERIRNESNWLSQWTTIGLYAIMFCLMGLCGSVVFLIVAFGVWLLR